MIMMQGTSAALQCPSMCHKQQQHQVRSARKSLPPMRASFICSARQTLSSASTTATLYIFAFHGGRSRFHPRFSPAASAASPSTTSALFAPAASVCGSSLPVTARLGLHSSLPPMGTTEGGSRVRPVVARTSAAQTGGPDLRASRRGACLHGTSHEREDPKGSGTRVLRPSRGRCSVFGCSLWSETATRDP